MIAKISQVKVFGKEKNLFDNKTKKKCVSVRIKEKENKIKKC